MEDALIGAQGTMGLGSWNLEILGVLPKLDAV